MLKTARFDKFNLNSLPTEVFAIWEDFWNEEEASTTAREAADGGRMCRNCKNQYITFESKKSALKSKVKVAVAKLDEVDGTVTNVDTHCVIGNKRSRGTAAHPASKRRHYQTEDGSPPVVVSTCYVFLWWMN